MELASGGCKRKHVFSCLCISSILHRERKRERDIIMDIWYLCMCMYMALSIQTIWEHIHLDWDSKRFLAQRQVQPHWTHLFAQPPHPSPPQKKNKEKHTSYHAQTGPVLWVCYTPAPAHTRPALGWVRSPQGRAQHAGHRHFVGSVPSRYFPCAPDRDANLTKSSLGFTAMQKKWVLISILLCKSKSAMKSAMKTLRLNTFNIL